MEAVKAWCIKIAGVLILSVLCEGVLPSGEVKKYVRILTGIVLTICVCSPLAGGVENEFRIDEVVAETDSDVEKMEEKERESVLRLYKANLEKKMNDDLSAVITDCAFEFQLEVESGNMEEFGKIRGVIVTVITENDELYVNELIEKVLSEKYGVSVKNIAVNYRDNRWRE